MCLFRQSKKFPTQNTPAPQEQSKTNIPEKSQQKEEKSEDLFHSMKPKREDQNPSYENPCI
jgi:hypothetical protein